MRLRLITAVLAGVGLLCAQPAQVKKTRVTATSPDSGKEMYVQYCAVCHGKDGKGGGPAATALKSAPTDLTKLSAGNNGKFPETRVVHVIEGADNVAAHGSRDMPIWGALFNKMDGSGAVAKARLANLTAYLQSMQAK